MKKQEAILFSPYISHGLQFYSYLVLIKLRVDIIVCAYNPFF